MEQLIPFILKSFLLAGAALGLLWLLRGRSAAARSVVAHLALLALVLMPVANLFLPPLRIAVAQLADPPVFPEPLDASLTNRSSIVPPVEAIGARPSGQVTPVDDSFAIPSEDWAVLAYASPAIGLLLMALVGIGRLFVLRARSSVIEDATWLRALGRAKRRMGVRQRTGLLVSDDLPSPISWGLMRPVIILDRETLHLHEHAEAMIAHELAHIARFDWARLLFARVATALYWFNPLVWILAREAHQLREEAADDAVLAANVANTDYAHLLVRTARHQFHGLLLTSHGVAPSRHSLARRIRRVLDATSARGPVARGFAAGVGLGILAVATPLAALSFDAKPAPTRSVTGTESPRLIERIFVPFVGRDEALVQPQIRQEREMTERMPPAAMIGRVGATLLLGASPGAMVPAVAQPAVAGAPAPRIHRDCAFYAQLLGSAQRSGNYEDAMRLLNYGVGQGDACAMLSLVSAYRNGLGVKKDLAKAYALNRQAAEAGDETLVENNMTASGQAMFLLATMHDFGAAKLEIKRDPAEAATWYRRWATTVKPSTQQAQWVEKLLEVLDRPGAPVDDLPFWRIVSEREGLGAPNR